eukprot:CAMPEP_0114538360 /NCGR_PEP_ID=MMETSP0109-20121206/30099_1 /TAXON_ID=29199 /ORGANISM="Chlorarachnion reptans, Strain CCCM449" /LENGTH=2283 /DNA_ID=CAMNT_0001722369 /DNA_START=209 /DNA_END=7060 /DNA_ORIENTATION=-
MSTPQSQLNALLKKNYLLKRSQLCQSTCEILSPLVICWLLVVAYTLFVDLNQVIPAQVYVNQTVQSSEAEMLVRAAAQMEFWTEPRHRGQGRLRSRPSIRGLLEGYPQCLPGPGFDYCVYAPPNATTTLGGLRGQLDAANADTNEQGRRRDKDDFRQDDGYNGALPIPTLDAYIAVHKLYVATKRGQEGGGKGEEGVDPTVPISNSSDASGHGFEDQQERVISAATSGEFDNLLRLGALIFAPDTDATWGLVRHLNRTTRFFHDYFGGVFRDEDSAVEAALGTLPKPFTTTDGETVRRAWATVVVRDMDVHSGHADYTIRMNFTATPSTKFFYHRFTPQLNTQYRKYYTSGFLSLQQAIATYYLNTTTQTMWPPPRGPDGPPIGRGVDPFNDDPYYWLNNVSVRTNLSNGTDGNRGLVWWEELTVAAPFPTPEVEVTLFFKVVGPTASVLITLSMGFTLSRLVRSVVDEKEKQLRLLLEMMGLRPWIFGLSWLITYAVVYMTIAVLVTIILYSSFMSHVEFFLLFCFIGLYCLTQLAFGVLVSAMFSRAKIASIVGPLLNFASMLPRYAFFYASASEQVSTKLWVSLFAPTAFSFGIDQIFSYGAAQAPLTWQRVWADELPFAAVLLMLLADVALYLLGSWAIDFLATSQKVPSFDEALRAVHQKAVELLEVSGIASSRDGGNSSRDRPAAFQLLEVKDDGEDEMDVLADEDEDADADTDANSQDEKSRRGSRLDSARSDMPLNGNNLRNFRKEERSGSLVEAVPEGMETLVEIRELRKVYERGCGAALQRTVAVDGLSLNLYQGQIACLLGHNGAGKTTTISLLTGMVRPTSGRATVQGYSIATDQLAIRRIMGVCPQHDILWDNLTVQEHLELFATLKGVPQSQLHSVCYAAAEEVSLAGRGYISRANALSGGMKRKLCVAIAFMGDPSVAYLDEPTSGMDPYSRRYVWNLLRSKKEGRAIVLTTHFMDEAELLADRIAIMAMGKLNCCGSPLYLKSRSGIGYVLTTVAASPEDQELKGEPEDGENQDRASGHPSMTIGCDTEAVIAEVKRVIPSATVVNVAAGEVSMRLPLKAVSQFAALFDALESNKRRLGVSGYGVSITTLEEVFIQVCRGGTLGEDALSRPGSPIAVMRSKADEGKKQHGSHGNARKYKSRMDSKRKTRDEDISERVDTQTGEELTETDDEAAMIGEVRPGGLITGEASEANAVPIREKSDAKINADNQDDSEQGDGKRVTHPLGTNSSFEVFVEEIQVWGSEFGRNLSMLWWKRAICAVRDLKALSYELLVPILTICLVLLILKLNVNPAGPSILLNAGLYGEHCADATKGEDVGAPEAVLSPPSEGPWDQIGPAAAYRLHYSSEYSVLNTSLATSLNVSEYLLANVLNHERLSSRINAFIPNDTLTLTVTESMFNALNLLQYKLLMAAFNGKPKDVPNLPPNMHGNGGKYKSDIGEEHQQHNNQHMPHHQETQLLQTHRPSLLGSGFEVSQRGRGQQQLSAAVHPLGNNDESSKQAWSGMVPATILHNSTYYHALPAGLSELHQARLRAAKGPQAYVRVRNHPLPLTKIASLYIDTLLTLFAAIFLLLPFCYLPGTLSMFWVRERELHVKHVHFVSGVTPLQYWLTAFLWDVTCVAIIDAIFIFVLMIYGNDEFIGTVERAWATYLLVLAYGMAVVPLSLLLSYAFSSASSAQVGIAAFHFVSGFVMLIIANILEAIPSTYDAAVFLKWSVFRMLPPFVLGEGLINLSVVALMQEVLGTAVSPWEWEVLGRSLAYLFSCSALYFIIVIGLDSKSEVMAVVRWVKEKIFGPQETYMHRANPTREREMQPMRRNGNSNIGRENYHNVDLDDGDDEELSPEDLPHPLPTPNNSISRDQDIDVAAEAKAVRAYLRARDQNNDHKSGSAAIAVDRLVKNYPPLAVNQLSLLVPKRQCFGLLGVNGAGKSTTLKMLTADVEPTYGRAYINGISVGEGVRAIRKQLGYCPQFNPLLPTMTVTETLWLYARLKGLTPEQSKSRSEELIDQLRLTPHAHKRNGALSGGNKRKVSLAIALVGDPPVLFLDEPSSGMDPVTRRYMWDLIAELGRTRCVVLTTHSMEECEALCHRVGIMSKGKLRCLGTLQRLKNRHGKGYHIEVSCPELRAGVVIEALMKEFPRLSVLESYGGKLKLRLRESEEKSEEKKTSLAFIFRQLELHKKRLGITDYSVSQSSLEQIFISMVRETFDEGGGISIESPRQASRNRLASDDAIASNNPAVEVESNREKNEDFDSAATRSSILEGKDGPANTSI